MRFVLIALVFTACSFSSFGQSSKNYYVAERMVRKYIESVYVAEGMVGFEQKYNSETFIIKAGGIPKVKQEWIDSLKFVKGTVYGPYESDPFQIDWKRDSCIMGIEFLGIRVKNLRWLKRSGKSIQPFWEIPISSNKAKALYYTLLPQSREIEITDVLASVFEIPQGTTVIVLGLTYEEGTYFFGFKEVTLNEGLSIKLDLKPTSREEITDFLDKRLLTAH